MGVVTLPPQPCVHLGLIFTSSMASLHCCFLLVPGYSVFLFSLALKVFPQLLPGVVFGHATFPRS